MMRTLADYVLTFLSMALVITLARALFEIANVIQDRHPDQAAQLVAIGWGLIALGVVFSIGSNWMRAWERRRDRRAMASRVQSSLHPAGSSHQTRVAGTD